MDVLDERLAEALASRTSLFAVMAANEDALRFYRRRGLVPVELVLWRSGNDKSPPGGRLVVLLSAGNGAETFSAFARTGALPLSIRVVRASGRG